MNEKKLLVIFLTITFVLLFGGIFLVSRNTSTPTVSASENAKAETAGSASVEFGQVAYNGANVERTFTIKNTGTDVLKIYNIKTSCHCTTAYVKINGSDSPTFGMSTLSSWVGEIKPGNTAKVKAIFDPKYHGLQGVGPVARYISVETNDKNNSKLTFTLSGEVTK